MKHALRTLAAALALAASTAVRAAGADQPIVGPGRALRHRRHGRHQLRQRRQARRQGDQRRRRHPRPQDRVHVDATRSRSPDVAKALAQKAVDEGAYVVMGPVFSGLDHRQHGRDASAPRSRTSPAARRRAITQKGNPYIFRTSFTQSTAMPKVARYIKDGVKAKIVAIIWVNNDFGKGGRDAMHQGARGRRASRSPPTSRPIRARSTSPAPCSRRSSPTPTPLFVYTNEEESARALRELSKQGYAKPLDRRDDAHRPEGDRARRRRRQRRGRARRPHRRRAAAGDQGLRREIPEGVQVQERPQRHEGLQRHVRRQGDHREDRQGRRQGVRRGDARREDLASRTTRACCSTCTSTTTATSTARASWSRSSNGKQVVDRDAAAARRQIAQASARPAPRRAPAA